MYEERRQLQNGADAAAVAVAAGYLAARSKGQGYGLRMPHSTAQDLADHERPRREQLDLGRVRHAVGDGRPRAAQRLRPAGRHVPDVRRGPHRDADGEREPPAVLLLVGRHDDLGRRPSELGKPGSYATFPITMSICEWNATTSNGTRYAPPPPYPPNPAASLEDTVNLQNSSGTGCNRGPADQFAPGGFGGSTAGAPAR